MVTIWDVAKRSGYSTTTVSIVLNDAPLGLYIPATTKRRIKKIADELSYRPNVFARSLRGKRSHTIGVIVFDISDPYCTQTLRGIENALYESMYLPIVVDVQNDRERFNRYVQMLLERRVDGIIALANSLYLQSDLVGWVKKRVVPAIAIGRQLDPESVSSVVVDNQAGSRAALDYLYKLGHRKIAFIRGPKMLVDSNERWSGIESLAQELDIDLSRKRVVQLKKLATDSQEGRKAADELIRRDRNFTALLAFDDMTAFGAISSLNHAGIRVPEDCSVIGFDDVAAAAFYNPPLTTIQQPMKTLGTMAVKILMHATDAAVAKKRFSPVHRKASPKLVVRESARRLEP